MTIAWLQLTCGRGPDSKSTGAFKASAEDRAWIALRRLQNQLLPQYDGAAWLAQGGFERVSVDVEYRADRRGRPRRTVKLIGRLVTIDVSVACPELADLSVEEIDAVFRPVVLGAFRLLGDAQALGPIPPAGAGRGLDRAPLRPLVEDPDA